MMRGECLKIKKMLKIISSAYLGWLYLKTLLKFQLQ